MNQDAPEGTTGNNIEHNDPPGVIITGEHPTVRGGVDDEGFTVVQEDVWLKYFPANSKRPNYSLIIGAGTILSDSQLAAMGISVDHSAVSTSVHDLIGGEVNHPQNDPEGASDEPPADETDPDEDGGDDENGDEEEAPKESDNKPAWVAWAVKNGADEKEAEAMTKKDLVEAYGE